MRLKILAKVCAFVSDQQFADGCVTQHGGYEDLSIDPFMGNAGSSSLPLGFVGPIVLEWILEEILPPALSFVRGSLGIAPSDRRSHRIPPVRVKRCRLLSLRRLLR